MGQWSHLYNNRAWRRLRASQLAKQPLCERCKDRGQVTPATICDHVLSHKGNLEAFWSGPFQSLCKPCHDVKTVMEDGGLNSSAQVHPAWLPKPGCPVVLVTGPACGGKTTYANKHKRMGDVVIDLDDCFTEVCGVHGHKADRKFIGPALRLRNKLLANLASKRQGMAYFIVGSPTPAECDWWIDKLDASHVRLDPGMDECLSRAVNRGDSKTVRVAIESWYARLASNQWIGPKAPQGHKGDGMPSDPSHHWNQ